MITYQVPRWWHTPLRKLGLIDRWMALWITVGLWRRSDAPPTMLERLYKIVRKGQGCDCELCLKWCIARGCSGGCLCYIPNCTCACG